MRFFKWKGTIFPTPPATTITTPTANIPPNSNASFTINNAGSNYVVAPLIIFVGGGGSGASAVGTVGTGGIISGYTNLMVVVDIQVCGQLF